MPMRSLALRLLTAVVVVWAMLGLTSGTQAQEATPPPGGFEIAPGVTAEALAFVPGQEAPSLYQLTFTPGTTYAFEPSPEISLVYVVAGGVTITLDAPVTVMRATQPGAVGDVVDAGTAFTFHVGDYTVFPAMVDGEVHNDGSEPATLLVSAIVPPAPADLVTPGATPAA
jgi:quercetin dioxygenase-like cupin family protein